MKKKQIPNLPPNLDEAGTEKDVPISESPYNIQESHRLGSIMVFSGLILLVMFAIAVWAWPQLPADARVPVHWNINGEPDRYGSKFEALFVIPFISAGLVVLFTFIPRIDPRRAHLAQSRRAYLISWGVILIFMLLTHIVVTLNILGQEIDVVSFIGVGLGVLLLVLGNYMGKIRSNYMFGIRTPWTLSSELAWNKTHRLGGKLFVLAGVLTILGAILDNPTLTFGVMFGSIMVAAIVPIIYSYFVWKRDPQANV